MATLHQKLSVVIVLGALLGTLWAGYVAYKGTSINRLRTASAVAAVVLLAQGLFGAVLGITGGRPAEPAHFVVGPLAVLALPVALLLARGRSGRGAPAVLLLGWLITLGLGLRSVCTGGRTACAQAERQGSAY